MRNKKAYYFKLNQFAEATEGTDQWRLGHKVNEQLVFMLKENSQTQTLFAKAMKLAIEQSGRSAMDINHQTKTLRLGVGAAGLFSAGLLVYGLLLQRKLRSSMQFLVNAISRVAAGDLTVRF